MAQKGGRFPHSRHQNSNYPWYSSWKDGWSNNLPREKIMRVFHWSTMEPLNSNIPICSSRLIIFCLSKQYFKTLGHLITTKEMHVWPSTQHQLTSPLTIKLSFSAFFMLPLIPKWPLVKSSSLLCQNIQYPSTQELFLSSFIKLHAPTTHQRYVIHARELDIQTKIRKDHQPRVRRSCKTHL